MSESDQSKLAARVKKHRTENRLKNELSVNRQNFRRSQLLATNTPVAEKMRKDAAERKRMQRLREKEGNVGRRMSGRGAELQGKSYHHHSH